MKRSLLTLLLELPAADLRAAAAAWAVPLRKRTHADNVALVYRAMTDRWTFTDLFDALPAAARDLLCALAAPGTERIAADTLAGAFEAGDGGGSLTDATAPLETAALALRGEGDTWFTAREVASMVAHTLRERGEGGDGTPPPVAHILAALDADDLADAARLWGVPDVAGNLRPGERERLLTELRRRVTTPRALAAVEPALSAGARRVVSALREATVPLPLNTAAALAGAETSAARRSLLHTLTTSLLACHTWVEGERVLVMPAEFREPAARAPAPLPTLIAVSAEATGGWRHPHALAWDVLTLLRLIEGETIRPVGGVGTLADDFTLARTVAPHFWVGAEATVPPAAALAFYATLAEAQGLLVETFADGRTTLAVRDPVAWAKHPFAAQTRTLFTIWRDLAGWPEGRGTNAALWGVQWPTFRTRLFDALAACAPDQWHTLENLLARLVAVRPPLLGEEFTAAGAAGQTPPDRDALTRLCIEATLRTALTWFGVVTWGRAGGDRPAVQLTDTGRWLIARGREPGGTTGGATPLTVDDAFRIRVLHAEPPHLWSLLAFAEVASFGRVTTYRITAATLRRALRRGLSVEQVVRFLAGRTGGALPDGARETLGEWAQWLRRVTLDRAAILTADDLATRAEAETALVAAGASVEMLADGRLLARHPDGPDALAAALHAADFTAAWSDNGE